MREVRRAHVRGEDHHRVRKVHELAAPVREAARVQNLQEQMHDARMRLLQLVHQHGAVRVLAHGVRELPAELGLRVARRRADEPVHGEVLRELAHVQAHKVRLAVEQLGRDRAPQQRLARAAQAREQERADGPRVAGEPQARAPDGVGHAPHRALLAYHALRETRLQIRQLQPVLRLQLRDRHAHPLGHHARHGLLAHGALQRLLHLQRVLERALLRTQRVLVRALGAQALQAGQRGRPGLHVLLRALSARSLGAQRAIGFVLLARLLR